MGQSAGLLPSPGHCVVRLYLALSLSLPPLGSQTLVSDGYIPVVASVASNGKGQGLNVNADTAAGEVSRHVPHGKSVLVC